MPERLLSLLYVSARLPLRPRLRKWEVDTKIMVRLRRSLLADGTSSLSRATLALGNFPLLNERQQTGIGLVMDLVGLGLINVLDSDYFSVETTRFDHLDFGFVTK